MWWGQAIRSMLLILSIPTALPPRAVAGQDVQGIAGGTIDKHLLRLVGPNAADAIASAKDGLMIRLPTAKPGRPQVGVESRFRICGDFKDTGSYALVSEGGPSDGYGAGVMLRIVKDSGPPSLKATLSRFDHPREKQAFITNLFEDRGKDGTKHRVKYYPAEARSGRLRLVRAGSTLRYMVSEGVSKDFREPRREGFGGEGSRAVALLGDTGGSRGPLTVRLTGFGVKGDELRFGIPLRQERSIWTIWSIVGLAGVVVSVG
jgi:hypothetical protein